MPSDIFDAEIAATYDDDLAAMFSPEAVQPAVDVLVELAGDGAALEFASGTGRIALPLAARGVHVHGIELSEAMASEMARKPGASQVPVEIGDMATTRVEGSFSLVFLVFNTITNLLTQDEQVDCFANAAAHLDDGGHFLVETGIPKLQQLHPGARFIPFDVTAAHIGVDEYDVVNQRSTSHHRWTRNGHTTSLASDHRWAWPAELDLMARLAGLTLVHRWGDWHRTPFTATSTSHISVWRRAGLSSSADRA